MFKPFNTLKDFSLKNERNLNNPISSAIFWFLSFMLAGYISAFGTKIVNIETITEWTSNKEINFHSIIALISTVFLAVFAFALNIAKQFREEEHHTAALTAPPARYWETYYQYFKESTQSYEKLETSTRYIYSQNHIVSIAQRKKNPENLLSIYHDDVSEVKNNPKQDQNKTEEQIREKIKPIIEKFNDNTIENIDQIEEFIRLTLKNILNLVKNWDMVNILGSGVTFRANIMEVLHNNSEDDHPLILSEFNENKSLFEKFCLYTVFEHYSGIVFLKDNKLTTTDAKGSAPDEDRKPIYFGFTLLNDKKVEAPETYNILGAPTAAATKQAQYISQATTIAEDYEKKATIKSQKILKNLEEQYRQNNNPAHSIISIPISKDGFIQGANSDVELPIKWIINIYRNQDGMLFGGRKTADFIDMASPFILLVAKALNLREKTSKSRVAPQEFFKNWPPRP